MEFICYNILELSEVYELENNMFVIIGLGNPGGKYESTRHNVGFNAIDLLGEKYGIKVSKLKFKALSGDGTIEGSKVLLVKPQTYMNLSGESVQALAAFFKIKWGECKGNNRMV